MFRKVALVSLQEGIGISRDDVNLAADDFGFAGSETADSQVGMETARDALKQFLIGFPCGGEDARLIGVVAADESVAGREFAYRTRVNVIGGDGRRTPDLARRIARLGCPWLHWQACQLPAYKDEALGKIVGGVACGLLVESCECTK